MRAPSSAELIGQPVLSFVAPAFRELVIERMRPLAVTGGAFLGSAGEMMAASQLQLGQRAAAGQTFSRVAGDTAVPESIRQRAVQMAGVLGADAPVMKQDSTPR